MASTSAATARFGSTENAKVLIVDDNVDLLKLISIRLKPMNFELKTVTSAEEALSLLSTWSADLVVTDLQMPGMSGMDLFDRIHAKNPLVPVIILTAHGTIPDAVEATQAGVSSYLTKPFDSSALVEHIQQALVNSGFITNAWESAPHSQDDQWRNEIVSKSPLMEALLDEVASLAQSNAAVLIYGEPGTGKNELARALHAKSHRAQTPLIHLPCSSLPQDIIDVELFGRVGKQSADNPERLGVLQQAHNSTLLLSDFTEATPEFIQRVLVALNAGKARPVDSDIEYTFDIRVVGTTAVEGRFSDKDEALWALAAKLGVSTLRVPTLAERREDIPLIAAHTLKKNQHKSDIQFSQKAIEALLEATWPGNIRQLINVVKQCIRLTKTRIISESLVQSRIRSRATHIQPLTKAHRDFEREYLTEVLKITNGNVTKAANLAKRNRTELHRLLKKHKIEAKSFRH